MNRVSRTETATPTSSTRIGDETSYRVDQQLFDFIGQEVLPKCPIEPTTFWSGFASILTTFSPQNQDLLAQRDHLQKQLDTWHKSNRSTTDQISIDSYIAFLTQIGYLEPDIPDFEIETENVDKEITSMAGPQLVVPIQNARFAINAANARWGSLYDALYGTNALAPEEIPRSNTYNPARGQAVINFAKNFLDQTFPLQAGSHSQVASYELNYQNLLIYLQDGQVTGLANPDQFVGVNGPKSNPESLLFRNNGLHVELQFDRTDPIGSQDSAGIRNIEIEAAITTIMDCEDSVSAVDAADKVQVYRNWLGLTTGELEATFTKNGTTAHRVLNGNRVYTGKNNRPIELPGRSMMLIRNMGLLTSVPMITTAEGQPVPEGIVDAVITSLIGSIDVRPNRQIQNSKAGSIYIVKPKLHGSKEVTFTNDLFAATEQLLDLPSNTIKLGIMDEERRTTINLKQCIKAANQRVVFINTGFLDRTGDEIHTGMEAGPFLPKDELKDQVWLDAYERRNVDIGLACGFQGQAQIGKGMWPKPDEMAQMMQSKAAHPQAGASTAWVPSPTAAVLHALHYHEVNVFDTQTCLKGRDPASIKDILCVPTKSPSRVFSAEEVDRELANNLQGILGYVSRWINQGIGCSKVPNIEDINLMEDRATLRISSQLVSNWLHHGICTEPQLDEVLRRMAQIVDDQNRSDPNYIPLLQNGRTSTAFSAARDLVTLGRTQPNGYTEPILYTYRSAAKNATTPTKENH